jgi:acyl transferase domain-containing protein
LTEELLKNPLEAQQHLSTLIGNSSDCLATRVSYCLNLTGPSMTIQSGCSSSLTAIHQARLSLLLKQCDAALVGSIAIAIPHQQGYPYVEGGVVSKDGHCRPFSSDASGTVFSSGYGVVVLKRLEDAVAQ